MSNINRLTEYENAMETVCDECKARHDLENYYCHAECMVRHVWRDILAEQKKEKEGKTMELTTVMELIEQLAKLPLNAKVYVGGVQGYLHITEDSNGNQAVVFDDSEELN